MRPGKALCHKWQFKFDGHRMDIRDKHAMDMALKLSSMVDHGIGACRYVQFGMHDFLGHIYTHSLIDTILKLLLVKVAPGMKLSKAQTTECRFRISFIYPTIGMSR